MSNISKMRKPYVEDDERWSLSDEEEAHKKAAIAFAEKILRMHGIQFSIGGCGCCGSPSGSFTYKGELIFDCYNVRFNSDDDTQVKGCNKL